MNDIANYIVISYKMEIDIITHIKYNHSENNKYKKRKVKKVQIVKNTRVYSRESEEFMSKVLSIFIGALICSIAVNGFFIPNKLISGGVTGISLIIHYITNAHTGLLIFILNIPIFMIGAKLIDRKFIGYSFVTMVMMSLLLTLTEGINQYININDVMLEAILGGVLNGLGMGIMFRKKVSQGGLDIIAAIFKKKFNINLGTILMGINTMIVGFSSFLFGLRPALYTMIALFIAYQIMEKVQIGLDVSNSVLIITDKPDDLPQKIHDKIGRGSTFLKAEGTYNKEDKKILYCTAKSTQIGKLKEIIEAHDPKAFMTINSIEEVKGKGFRNISF